MKTLLFLTLLSFFHSPEFGRKITWEGYLTQPGDDGLRQKYEFTLEFSDVRKDDSVIKGEGTIRFPDNSSNYGVYRIEGKVVGDYLYLRDVRIIEQQLDRGYWCYKRMKLQQVTEGNQKLLKGTWGSEDCGESASGDIILYRVDHQ